MSTKAQKQPGSDHPITVEPLTGRLTVHAGDHQIADTRNALVLQEANYPPVHYIPRSDVDMARLQRTERATYCPYKGDCSYFSIPGLERAGDNAVWTYEAPYAAVAAIVGYLAFYPDRVQAVVHDGG